MISRTFKLSYAHRVWDQEIHAEFCGKNDNRCKCRALHGHNATVTVIVDKIEGQEVPFATVDNKCIGWIGDFLDNNLDHRCLMDSADPVLYTMGVSLYESLAVAMGIDTSSRDFVMYSTIHDDNDVPIAFHFNLEPFMCAGNDPMYEIIQSYLVLEFVPTVDNLAQWLFGVVDAKMSKVGIKVVSVEWADMDNTQAIYVG